MTTYCEIPLPTHIFGPHSEALITPLQPFTLRLIECLEELTHRDDTTGRLLSQTLTEALRVRLIDRFAPPPQPRTPAARTLTPAEQNLLLRHIDHQSRVQGETSLETLAECVGMSTGTFTRAFAAAFHTTPHQFILDRRIAHAKDLLLTTAQSITEISLATGFSTHSHFTTTFRKRVGLPPTDYRHHLSESPQHHANHAPTNPTAKN